MRRDRAFTLIELLIVVAIIAILAAIAVPNFLEAQTRAKISRVKSDQRAVATALEAYHVDYNKYPVPYDHYGLSGAIDYVQYLIDLTTPVAYITSVSLRDPFKPTLVGAGAIFHNLESWLTGELFTEYPAVVGVGIAYGLLWAFLMGGLLDRYARPAEKAVRARFAQAGGLPQQRRTILGPRLQQARLRRAAVTVRAPPLGPVARQANAGDQNDQNHN